MEKINKETLIKVVEASSNPEVIVELLKAVALVEARESIPQNGDPEENVPTIPEDPDLSTIRYVSVLRRSLRGRKPDPLVMVALKAIMIKFGYPMLAKVVAKVARKMRFPLTTQDTEAILKKYGSVVIPFMAILLVDIIRRYYQLSRENQTKVDTKS